MILVQNSRSSQISCSGPADDREFAFKELGQEAEKIPTIVNVLIVANIRSYGQNKQSIHL